MLPVSGAAQLSAIGASRGLHPVSSASGAYCTFVSPAPWSPGQEEVPEAPLPRAPLQLPHDRAGAPFAGRRRELGIEHGLGREHMVVEEGTQLADQRDGAVVVARSPCQRPFAASRASPSAAIGSTSAPMRSKPSPTVSPRL